MNEQIFAPSPIASFKVEVVVFGTLVESERAGPFGTTRVEAVC
jgi:hypothetical protein